MKDLKDLCEKVLKDSEEFHRNHKAPRTESECLAVACSILMEAIERIATLEKPKCDDYDYWYGKSHAACAWSIWNDTRIARKALERAEEVCEVRNEGS